MEKLRFKKWVEYSLVVINVLLFFVMSSEIENTMLFMITHTGALFMFLINCYLLYKFTDITEE